MGTDQSERDFAEAMEACASEPVHIPGIVQPFGCLIGVASDGGQINYASENCESIIGMPSSDLLGAKMRDAFGPDIAHALNNVMARSVFAETLTSVGQFQLGGNSVDLSAFGSGDTHVLQFEPSQKVQLGGSEALNILSSLMNEIHACTNEGELFKLTTDLLRHVSEFDRVMIYKFDRDFNGEVIAEAKQRSLESFQGLRFPQWDIPVQARAIMAKVPLRFIQDVMQEPIPLHAANTSLPPLDITLAECRGVSAVHMEYLQNMNVAATMSLSIVVEGSLWGLISFHHRQPRVPAPQIRELLTAFLNLFTTKLSTLMKQKQLNLVHKTDSIKETTLGEIDEDETLSGSMSRIGAVTREVLEADGFALLTGSKTLSFGKVPEQAVLETLRTTAQDQLGTPIISENLASMFPDLDAHMNECAGVLASAGSANRTLCVFREATANSISWAGNPEKTIEDHSGEKRLAPRGSFSKYLEDVKGCSAPWTSDDVYFIERIWILIDSAERRTLKNTLNRQQALMIDELNHRVRNILALVRSVSRQARRHYGSLESYSASLESRISALAAAHDIASGSSVMSVSLQELIDLETSPYKKENVITVEGHDASLRADIAPIFSLVIHELATNAAKYGALSTKDGKVSVTIENLPEGISIAWREQGGPSVTPPNDRGFGSALIEQAVPHELSGRAKLQFPETGVEADLFLPNDVLDLSGKPLAKPGLQGAIPVADAPVPFDPNAFDGVVLLLEDNFVIAKDLKDQLKESGLRDVAMTSTAGDALEIIALEDVTFAILDVNLGSGQTSEQVALELQRKGIPFLFATGYGDKAELHPELENVPRLTKPVTGNELQATMMAGLKRDEG